MNESEWLACPDPWRMLDFLRGSGNASDRRFRLFAAACYRRVWHLLADPRTRHAVGVLERLADGGAPRGEVEQALRGACNAAFEAETLVWDDDLLEARGLAAGSVYRAFATDPAGAAGQARDCCTHAAVATAGPANEAAAERAEEVGQCRLLRDIFGGLFRRPPAFPLHVPAWCGGLAQAAYDNRELPSGHLESSRLAVLADALEDAGVSEGGLLDHLRGPGPHVRGCHVLDAISGRG
ncbi:MAG TPA: hypothetical protein VFE78_31165 [Gemmataceae bacterium]|jgi:hypothetical protein|nr:hypothetical protein [Gemmataceae bacterium]